MIQMKFNEEYIYIYIDNCGYLPSFLGIEVQSVEHRLVKSGSCMFEPELSALTKSLVTKLVVV